MNTPEPITLPAVQCTATNGALGGVIAITSVIASEFASMEHIPLAYYAATFGGLALVVSIIKVWSWVSDQWRKEIQLSETRMTGEIRAVETRVNAELRFQFDSFKQLEEERHSRIEQMIELLCNEKVNRS